VFLHIRYEMAAIEKRPEIIELARGLAGVPMCDDYERMISGMMYVRSIGFYLQQKLGEYGSLTL
jgi:hypothetical protein